MALLPIVSQVDDFSWDQAVRAVVVKDGSEAWGEDDVRCGGEEVAVDF